MGETVRCWLVDRNLEDGRVITTTYATTDGSAVVTRQRALSLDHDGVPVSIKVDEDELAAVDDAATRRRYQDEVERLVDDHEPSDRV